MTRVVTIRSQYGFFVTGARGASDSHLGFGLMQTLTRILAVAAAAALTLSVATPATAASPTGHKHVTVKLTDDDHIVVKWKATTGIKYYKVKTSSTPDMTQDVKSYKVAKSKTKLTIDASTKRYAYASPASGNYVFVRVYAVKKNGKIGESPYKRVSLNPEVPNPAAQRLTVATFNVRTADTEIPGHTWASRLPAVAQQINASGAQVVALQEAGANLGKTVTAPGVYDIHWQFEDVDNAVDPRYALVNGAEYSLETDGGKEGTRILYDTTALKVVDSGFFAPSAVDKYLRWVPWAKFQSIATGETFFFISAHLDNRKDSGDSTELYELRREQIGTIIDEARRFSATGFQVVLAGDLNSNIYSVPDNGVARKLLAAGFYDAYATNELVNPFRVTYNGFESSKSSASRTDYIMTFGRPDLRGSFSYKDWIDKVYGIWPSDHNMQSAVVPF